MHSLAVTQGHRVPPMLRADRAAWYARRELAAADGSEKAPLLSDPEADALGPELAVDGEGDTPILDAPGAERERSTSVQAVEGAPDQQQGRGRCGSLQRRLVAATEWDELSRIERASFCFESIVHVLRGLTIPVIPEDDELSGPKWDTAFQRLRAVCAVPGCAAWMALYVERRVSDVDNEGGGGLSYIFVYGLPVSVFVLLVNLPWCPIVYHLTRDGMPRWLRQAFVIPAFVSSIAWFDVGADELVEVLRTFAHILNLPIAVLGVTVLAWGNSISDLLANRAIAREGHAKMAISGCYGEPIFNRFFGVGLAYAVITLPTYPNPYTDGIFIDAALVACFGFQTLALLVTLAAGMLDQFRIRAWLGWVLILIYSTFMVVVVLVILYLPADWRLRF